MLTIVFLSTMAFHSFPPNISGWHEKNFTCTHEITFWRFPWPCSTWNFKFLCFASIDMADKAHRSTKQQSAYTFIWSKRL